MTSNEVRKIFLDFFAAHDHRIVKSAPMVLKDDPTLMFTNAGMNQFKDLFLGNRQPSDRRLANTQKCLRVSGKHNDLEEVGHDTYHHTMFEMLGNWSIGDYFKKEAIRWAWDLLTETYGISKEDLYATVFEGDPDDGLPADEEAAAFWREMLPDDRVLYGSKKDNFWEMGDTGPCGPCSEIHVDIRPAEEKEKLSGRELVNKSHPQVIEIWNLVFIEYNRKMDGSLDPLPQKHIDTGMGFERLCMVLQGKRSNYDTDVFRPIIDELSMICGYSYGEDDKRDVAMRVVADHLRAIAFAIADGQLPSNTGAGYVIRRILRRAVRYGFTFLALKEPFINQLVPVLVKNMGGSFPELKAQQEMIRKVVAEEELAFLRTLSQGIKRFEQYVDSNQDTKVIGGEFAFELFDTYGFPVDLTRLMALEKGMKVDMEGFRRGLDEQKDRSRQAAQVSAQEWTIVKEGGHGTEFLGYESLEAEVQIVKFRKISQKKQEYYEIVLDRTPFYAESGGQVGDRGVLLKGDEKVEVVDTYRENEMIIHRTDGSFQDPGGIILARVDAEKRTATENNHSATHLLHAALRKILGSHVEQKGSLVNEKYLRFDFSHFTRMTGEEIRQVEKMVNRKIRQNIPIGEEREVPFDEARNKGAIALFGEKYGESVRVISFDPKYSVELCGGTHVGATGQIGLFKIMSEGAIAAGIRRIEAVTAGQAEEYVYEKEDLIGEIQDALKNVKDLTRGVRNLVEENKTLQRQIDALQKEKVSGMKGRLFESAEEINGISFIATEIEGDAKTAKDLAFSLGGKEEKMVVLIGNKDGGKVNLTLMISGDLVQEGKLHAGDVIRDLAGLIRGGGGGQPHFASAGGSDPSGIPKAFEQTREILRSL